MEHNYERDEYAYEGEESMKENLDDDDKDPQVQLEPPIDIAKQELETVIEDQIVLKREDSIVLEIACDRLSCL